MNETTSIGFFFGRPLSSAEGSSATIGIVGSCFGSGAQCDGGFGLIGGVVDCAFHGGRRDSIGRFAGKHMGKAGSVEVVVAAVGIFPCALFFFGRDGRWSSTHTILVLDSRGNVLRAQTAIVAITASATGRLGPFFGSRRRCHPVGMCGGYGSFHKEAGQATVKATSWLAEEFESHQRFQQTR